MTFQGLLTILELELDPEREQTHFFWKDGHNAKCHPVCGLGFCLIRFLYLWPQVLFLFIRSYLVTLTLSIVPAHWSGAGIIGFVNVFPGPWRVSNLARGGVTLT